MGSTPKESAAETSPGPTAAAEQDEEPTPQGGLLDRLDASVTEYVYSFFKSTPDATPAVEKGYYYALKVNTRAMCGALRVGTVC